MCLRDLYVRGKYNDFVLAMTVLRRFEPVLQGGQPAVFDIKAALDDVGVVEEVTSIRQVAGQAFYNTARLHPEDLRARASRQQFTAEFQAYLYSAAFAPNVQDILDNSSSANNPAPVARRRPGLL